MYQSHVLQSCVVYRNLTVRLLFIVVTPSVNPLDSAGVTPHVVLDPDSHSKDLGYNHNSDRDPNLVD